MSDNSKKIKQAKKAFKRGDYFAAGKIYEELGDLIKAIDTYEAGELYNEMGELYEKLNEETQAIKMYGKGRNFQKLLKNYQNPKNAELAASILEKNDFPREAAEIYYNHEKYEKAAKIYEKRGFFKKAAYVYEKSGNLKKAAVNFEKWFLSNIDTPMGYQDSSQLDQDLFKVVELYIKIEEFEKAYNLLLKNKKNDKAARLAYKLGKLEDAAKLFEKAQLPLKAADIYEEMGKGGVAYLLRGEDAFARGNTAKAAELFLKGKDYTRAAELFEWGKNFEKAGHCYFMNQNYIPAAKDYLKAGKEDEAAKMFELGKEWKTAADISLKYKKFRKAGELYEKARDYYNAGICFTKIEDDKRALTNFQQVRHDNPHFSKAISDMGTIFLKNRKPWLVIEKIGRLLKDKPINKVNMDWYYVLGQAYENSGDFKKAHEIFQGILAENYSYKDVHDKIKEVEALIEKYKEMDLVEDDSPNRYKIIKKIGEGGMGLSIKLKTRF